MEKRWPLGLIKRGTRIGSSNDKVIWWQEPEPPDHKGDIVVSTVEAARSIGYESHYLLPVSYAETLAGAAENLLAACRDERDDHEDCCEKLEMVVQSYRDNVGVVNG